MDFTVKTYHRLLDSLLSSYRLTGYKEFLENPAANTIIIRQDVDKKKLNALQFAEIQNKYGIRSTFYFRILPVSFDARIIGKIFALGHEIGYHYETMDTCLGNVDKAYDEFCRNLETFRKVVPVHTICMHGSPLSKFDNREIWKKYDYRDLQIIAEPYFNLDFNEVFYLTDTGRRWDGASVSVRDKAMASRPVQNADFVNRSFHSTFDIIKAVEQHDFPDKVMMTFHPQRWTDNVLPWLYELMFQNLKNQVKSFLVNKTS